MSSVGIWQPRYELFFLKGTFDPDTSAGAIAYPYYYGYGPSYGPIWLYSLNCTGLEQEILNCSVINYTSSVYCDNYYDSGVMCIGKSNICFKCSANNAILYFP